MGCVRIHTINRSHSHYSLSLPIQHIAPIKQHCLYASIWLIFLPSFLFFVYYSTRNIDNWVEFFFYFSLNTQTMITANYLRECRKKMGQYKSTVTAFLVILMILGSNIGLPMVMGDPKCSRKKHCNPGICCSIYNWCGTDAAHCSDGNCVSQCWPGVTAVTNYTLTGKNLTSTNNNQGVHIYPCIYK